jgi:septal ring factor EnvC (AmiA/AmiB activator)
MGQVHDEVAVAIADGWAPSKRLRAAAAAERGGIERKLERLATRERALAAELASVRAARAELERQRDLLGRFVGDNETARTPVAGARRSRALPEPEVDSASGTTVLRGARIRRTALRLLVTNGRPDAPIHYRDWFALLTAQGFMPAGRDPLATFLTQIRRLPLVRRTASSGTYMVDTEFPRRAREQLARLGSELAQRHEAGSNETAQEIATARERRARLTAQMRATERQLEEALQTLADLEAQLTMTPAARGNGATGEAVACE